MPRSFDTQAVAILHFYKSLRPDFKRTDGIEIMNPYLDEQAWTVTKAFYEKFYGDAHPRIFIFGINPGRFGGGVTGVPFTDPEKLRDKCGIPIPSAWKKLPELSSQFIYDMIEAYGGVKDFYRHFFITALSPLGFTRHGKNLNYYDDKALLKACEPFILQCIRRQLEILPASSTCFCLGEGENYKQFKRINEQHGFFKEIIPLPHPRFVMQYRRKKIPEYIELYVQKFNAARADLSALEA
ncbi:MAG TPA: uracil-DNA glycosylase family protein [Puia sp.]